MDAEKVAELRISSEQGSALIQVWNEIRDDLQLVRRRIEDIPERCQILAHPDHTGKRIKGRLW